MTAPLPTSRRWYLLTLLGWTLALAAAAGATSPRPRTAARERGPRATILRGGSPRANERQGWVIPDPTSPGARVERDDDAVGRPAAPGFAAALPAPRPGAGAPRVAVLAPSTEAPRRPQPPASRPYAGRAPPSC